jgi:hypothetical protein
VPSSNSISLQAPQQQFLKRTALTVGQHLEVNVEKPHLADFEAIDIGFVQQLTALESANESKVSKKCSVLHLLEKGEFCFWTCGHAWDQSGFLSKNAP